MTTQIDFFPVAILSQFAMLIFLMSLGIFVHIHDILRYYMSMWNDMRIIPSSCFFIDWIGLFSCFLKSHIFKILIWFSFYLLLYKNWRTHKTPVNVYSENHHLWQRTLCVFLPCTWINDQVYPGINILRIGEVRRDNGAEHYHFRMCFTLTVCEQRIAHSTIRLQE